MSGAKSVDLQAAATAQPAYTWTQTTEDLTLQVSFPPGTSASSVACNVSHSKVAIGLRGQPPIVEGELWDALSNHVWSLEGGTTLSLELEKARSCYWPCALKGGPEVDIKALKARDKAEAELPYKPHPDADSMPRRVTDRETLLKLKAEMPQLEIPGLEPASGVVHKNYSGARRKFEWGALPTVKAGPPTPAVVAPPEPTTMTAATARPAAMPTPGASSSSSSSSGAPLPPAASTETSAAAPAAAYSWGAVPGHAVPGNAGTSTPSVSSPATQPVAASQATPAMSGSGGSGGSGKYSWGALPGQAAAPSAQSVHAAAAGAAAKDRERARLLEEIRVARAHLSQLEEKLRRLDE